MSSTEGLTIVEQESAIGDVERRHCNRETLGECLSERKIKSGMRLQVFGKVARAIHEARSVIQIAGCPCPERQRHVEIRVQRVALIVIEKEVAAIARREVRQPTSDGAFSLRMLVRVSEIELPTLKELRRPRR